jgi:hypothetical protein
MDSGLVKRCPVCWRIWQAEAMTQEDGQDRCPTCVSGGRSESEKAETLAREQAYAASREPEPQMSQATLDMTVPGTIRNITDADGARVYDGSPLNMIRTVAKTLLLLGRDFSADDTITGSTGLTLSVTLRTATQTTLSVTADVSMSPGTFSMTFNDVVFRNIFSVR